MANEYTSNQKLIAWVDKMSMMCKPTSVYWCSGSDEEYKEISDLLVKNGTFIKLNEEIRPNSFYCRSDPADVARVEDRTFICTPTQEEVGPTNNWRDPEEMKATLNNLFIGSMKGRIMYVIPFSMGPIGSKISHIGVQLTDSPYVVCSMKIMTRIGKDVLTALGNNDFVECLHSVGVPLEEGVQDVPWPCNPDNKYIVHFPREKSIWSYGSGYGGNALLGKKCFALRIASYLAKEEGWLAEHMLVLGITNPEGRKKYFAGAFPSACGKTNLAMLTSTLPGWKVETVGDDIAWMKFGKDGRLYAINPEAGFFGVAPGTSMDTNPNAMLTITKNTIFTNVALTPEGDVWWEGKTKRKPEKLTDWLGKEWTPESETPAAHPNSRFTTPSDQCPVMDKNWENPEGVPISGILFGSRRAHFIPLVHEALNWQHGVFIGSVVSSEKTAAASGKLGEIRHDPFAMLPFCGYNMGDYFAHWLNMGTKTTPDKLPKFFYVNWFRKDEEGRFLWPGFGENIRVLKWIFERTDDKKKTARETPIGYLPTKESLDITGIEISKKDLETLLSINVNMWRKEVEEIRQYYKLFGTHLPDDLKTELEALNDRLKELKPV